jgi:peptidyl-tRNA hydrolase
MTVCVLGVDSSDELNELATRLEYGGIANHLWIEKPEMIPTALATGPVKKEDVQAILGHLKLLR